MGDETSDTARDENENLTDNHDTRHIIMTVGMSIIYHHARAVHQWIRHHQFVMISVWTSVRLQAQKDSLYCRISQGHSISLNDQYYP